MHRFMDSLQWVDQTYTEKHKFEDPATLRPMYHSNLQLYSAHGDTSKPRRPKEAVRAFLIRYGRRAAISLLVYILSFTPVVGRFVLPAASFYTLNKTLGPLPASVIFGSGIFLPKRYLVLFLQSFFASRSLMRELVRVLFFSFFFSFSEQSLKTSYSAKIIISSNPTSLESDSPKTKKSAGSAIARVYSLASAWGSTSF